ncbi:hypothetical protein GGF50DRAFT_55637 [Schizophyllum commune]
MKPLYSALPQPAILVDATHPTNTQTDDNSAMVPTARTSTPIATEVFYDPRPFDWIRRRAQAGFGGDSFFLLQVLASIIYAEMQSKEAPFYATWMLQSGENLTGAEILVNRMKLAVSTICPQLAVASQNDPLAPEDMIGAELAEEAEDSDDLNVDELSIANASRAPEQPTLDDSDQQAQQTSARTAAQEYELRAGSVRIPDFVQVSHIFDLSQTKEDIFELFRELSYDAAVFRKKAAGKLPHLRSQVTLLLEIKPDGEYSFFSITRFNKQLGTQAKHFFASGVQDDAIGGVLALGKMFTYREFTRSNLRYHTESPTPFDDQEYLPERPTVKVRRAPRGKKFSTELEESLHTTFLGGTKYIDVHSEEGQMALDTINRRAQELFPLFWGRNTKHNIPLKPGPFDTA